MIQSSLQQVAATDCHNLF